MKIRAFVATLLLLTGAQVAMAIEEASYAVLRSDGKFEVREYAPHVLAETLVAGELEDAGSKAFKLLFRYISGDNVSRTKVAMTAPVSQQPVGEKIRMTAPVGQQRVQDQWAVSFMMPKSYTLESLPQPSDSRVSPAAGACAEDGRRSLLRHLERKQLRKPEIRTGVVDASERVDRFRQRNLGPVQSPVHPVVPAAQ